MGKGDRRTKRGKIWRSSFGVVRPRKKKNSFVKANQKEEKAAE